jgi:hypothetical protein
MVEAILWDNDGVLVDTECLFFESTRRTLAAVGIQLSQEQFLELSMRQGRSAFDLAIESGRPKKQVANLKREPLLPLPLEPFRYYQYGERIVHLDGCVEVEAAYYGAPPGWIGRVVRVQWDDLFVRLLDPKTGQLLREHVRQKRGWYRIKPEDHSKRTPLRVSQLLWRAGRAGTHIGTLCEAIHRQQGEVGVRRILGVLSLAKKYGAAAVDEACAAALEMECRNIASFAAIWNAVRKPHSVCSKSIP